MMCKIQLHENFIKGSIPFSINQCKELSMSNLKENELTWIIHDMSSIPLIDVDRSQNNLTRMIPSSLSNCITLESFNVCFNSPTGPIPSSGIFPDTNQSSYTDERDMFKTINCTIFLTISIKKKTFVTYSHRYFRLIPIYIFLGR